MLLDWLLRYKAVVFILFFSTIVATIPGLARIQITPDNRVFYGPENKQFNEFLDFEASYIPNNNIIFVVSFGEKLEKEEHASAIRWLTDRIWTIQNVIRVDSLSSHPHAIGTADEIAVQSALDHYCPEAQACKKDFARLPTTT